MPSRGAGVLSQDWEPVVLSKRAPRQSEKKDPNAVSEALRAGAPIETVKKFAAGSNKAGSTAVPTLNTKKLDDDTENLSHDKLSSEVKQNIQKARLAAKLTQAQLAQKINEKPQVVQEYESGKAIPNQQVLAKLERVLGVKLRGLKK